MEFTKRERNGIHSRQRAGWPAITHQIKKEWATPPRKTKTNQINFFIAFFSAMKVDCFVWFVFLGLPRSCWLLGAPFNQPIQLPHWFHSINSINFISSTCFHWIVDFTLFALSFILNLNWVCLFVFSFGRSHWRPAAHNPPTIKNNKLNPFKRKFIAKRNQSTSWNQKRKIKSFSLLIEWSVDFVGAGCLREKWNRSNKKINLFLFAHSFSWCRKARQFYSFHQLAH